MLAADEAGAEAEEEDAGDEEGDVEDGVADVEGVGGEEADPPGKEGAADAEEAEDPDPVVAEGDPVGAGEVGMEVAEADGGGKHQQVHDQVELDAEGGKDPVGATNGRHPEKKEAEEGDECTLAQEEVVGAAVPVGLFEEGGEVSFFGSGEKAFAWAC